MIYIIVALVLYTAAIMFGAFAARHAGAAVVSTITNVVAVMSTLAFAIAEMSRQHVVNQRVGLIAAALGGLAIGAFTIALNKSFATGKVAIVSPVVFGGSIFLTAILGYFIFKERITPYQGVGLALLAMGLGFIIYAKATGK